jgi:hypothetical protein
MGWLFGSRDVQDEDDYITEEAANAEAEHNEACRGLAAREGGPWLRSGRSLGRQWQRAADGSK